MNLTIRELVGGVEFSSIRHEKVHLVPRFTSIVGDCGIQIPDVLSTFVGVSASNNANRFCNVRKYVYFLSTSLEVKTNTIIIHENR